MGRWQPGAEARLQEAAVELFLREGYDAVTVTHIAERAGLTRRTFFNYFADKREVLFAGAGAFQAEVLERLARADAAAGPVEAAAGALAATGEGLARYGEGARLRRDVVAASPELREREASKMAALGAAMAEELERRRELAPREAALAAHAALGAFGVAFDAWLDAPGSDLGALVGQALDGLRAVLDGRTAGASAG